MSKLQSDIGISDLWRVKL